MNRIYHYSDLNGFFNIIKHKKLWLSASNNLNDYKEVDWFVDKIQKKVSQLVTTDNQELFNTFWQLRTLNSTMPYICSFSKNGDLSSQWRAYADDGHGIAIGFNRDYFKFQRDIPAPNTSKKLSTGITDVLYDEEKQNQIIKDIISLIKPELEGDKTKPSQFTNAALLINKYSYICKNMAFREEDEVRIIHTPLITGVERGKPKLFGEIGDLNYRMSAQTLTSYFELDFSEEKGTEVIIDIVLGPKCKARHFDIKLFLGMNGFGNVPFEISTATYR